MGNLKRLLARMHPESKNSGRPAYYAQVASQAGLIDDASKIEGLIGWHFVDKTDGSSAAVTYWATELDFNRARTQWPGLFAATLEAGAVGQIYPAREPWWKRVNLQSVVLALAGVLAALETIKNHSDRVLARPEIAVRFQEGVNDAVEGANLTFKAILSNPVQAMQFHVKSLALLKPQPDSLPPNGSSAGVALAVSESDIPELPMNDRRELVLTAVAPASGAYMASLDVSAESGWFRSARRFVAEKPVKIWSSRPVGKVSVEGISKTRAQIRGIIEIGREAKTGLRCEIEIAGVPRLHMPVFNSNPKCIDHDWVTAETPGKEVALATWSLAPLPAMQKVDFEAFLEGSGATDWKALERHMSVACDEAPTGVSK